MIAADTPPPTPPAAQVMVVSRRDASEVIAAQDLPLVLMKGPRREDALVRRAVFVTSALTVTQPAEATAPDRYRWTYRSFLQRQVCFTSMIGLFSCTEPQVIGLPDVAEGDAPLAPDPETFPLAETARGTLTTGLRARAQAIFAADRRAVVDPIFKASGVIAQTPGAAARKP